MHHIFYIDDSGTKEYADSPEDYAPSGNSRYFCFGGVLATQEISAKLGDAVADHKRDFFGTDDVEVKSNWLRIPKERIARYLQPYDLDDTDVMQFVDGLYEIVSDLDVVLLAAVVDKVHMVEDYGENAWYAPAIAYEVLAQRLVREIRHPDTVSIVVDDMDGATPKGNQYKANLKRHHRSLRQNGSRLHRGLDWAPLQGQRFVDSSRSHHIQVADIVAYNVFRQFVEHGDDWEDTAKDILPTYDWFAKLAGKFRNHEGRIQGFGVIKFPLRKRIRWGLKKE